MRGAGGSAVGGGAVTDVAVPLAELRGLGRDGVWTHRQVVSLRYPPAAIFATLLPLMQQQVHADLVDVGLEADPDVPAAATCETVTDPPDPTAAPHRIVTLRVPTRRCRC